MAQTKEIFSAKIGSIASNLYSRIATPDLHEHNEKSTVERYTRNFLDELGYSSVTWLSPFQLGRLEELLRARLDESGLPAVSQQDAAELLKLLPKESDAIADRVLAVLSRRGIISGDPENLRRVKNLLLNDRQFKRLADR